MNWRYKIIKPGVQLVSRKNEAPCASKIYLSCEK